MSQSGRPPLEGIRVVDFSRVIENCAARREVHPLPTYLETLATRFHQFYTVHRVLVDDADAVAQPVGAYVMTWTDTGFIVLVDELRMHGRRHVRR